MRKIERPPAPDFLKDNYKNWGKRFKKRRDVNPTCGFSWTQYEGKRTNLLLLPDLMKMTEKHCSFCDGFPIETVSSNTIEHFRPKSQYPYLAYTWMNLFYCCSKCQESKLENFDKKLLKPDVDDYSFEYYFQYETDTGKIIPNPDRLDYEIERADITITLYSWNEYDRPNARKRTLRMYRNSNNPVLSDFPYRFILNYVFKTF